MEPGLSIVLLVINAILHAVLVDGVSIETSSTTCGQVFDSKSDGVIQSPNFPSSYNETTKCQWIIKIPKGHQMTLKFEAFMLEESPNCENAYLEIAFRNNANDSNQEANRYCGSNKPKDIETTNIETVLTLQTGLKSFPGFDSSFRTIQTERRKAAFNYLSYLNGAIDNVQDLFENKFPNIMKNAFGNSEDNEFVLPENENTDDGTCDCGVVVKSRRKRIVGGGASPANKWPYLVILIAPYNPTRAHCGGALISAKWVVSASHCVYKHKPEDYLVVAGTHDLQAASPSQRQKSIKTIYLHEDYEHQTEKNDISLLELESAFELNSVISTICLPPQGLKLEGETGVAAGYGRKAYAGAYSMIPMEVELPIVGYDECVRSFSNTNAAISKQMLCAGVLDGSKDACQGDSGGPLMWLNSKKNRYYIIGITSFGVKCATKDYYGVYTRVSEYNKWIKNIIGEVQCPKI